MGITSPFQALPALESRTTFGLTSGFESAVAAGPLANTSTGTKSARAGTGAYPIPGRSACDVCGHRATGLYERPCERGDLKFVASAIRTDHGWLP